jgi:anaphase-promoting complex subunit 8
MREISSTVSIYLYGVLLKEKNKKDQAREVFIKALNKNPLLWSAWLELASLITQNDRRVLE